MHKVDGPGADANNEFVSGNPFVQIAATVITAAILNTFQRELVKIVEDEGITLDKQNDTQLAEALRKRIERAMHLRYTLSSSPYAVVVGDGVRVLDTFGIAQAIAGLGAPVEILVAGKFTLPKAAVAMLETDGLYWDNAARNLTTTAAGNFLCCTALEAKDAGDATISVRLGVLGFPF